MKTRSWLMISLIGMMSLVGCPSPADVDNSSDNTTEEENNSSFETGNCEELLTLHLDFDPNPVTGENVLAVEPSFPGVPNPEKIVYVSISNRDSNERFYNSYIKVLVLDNDLAGEEEFIVFDTNFNVYWALESGDARPFLFKLCYREPTGFERDRLNQGFDVKVYLKYLWLKN
jgi:hypothetical protein